MTESDNKQCKSQADGKFCKHVTATPKRWVLASCLKVASALRCGANASVKKPWQVTDQITRPKQEPKH